MYRLGRSYSTFFIWSIRQYVNEFESVKTLFTALCNLQCLTFFALLTFLNHNFFILFAIHRRKCWRSEFAFLFVMLLGKRATPSKISIRDLTAPLKPASMSYKLRMIIKVVTRPILTLMRLVFFLSIVYLYTIQLNRAICYVNIFLFLGRKALEGLRLCSVMGEFSLSSILLDPL